MTDWLILLVGALCTFRISWLLTHDYLTSGVRNVVIRTAYRIAYRRKKDQAPPAVYAKSVASAPDFWTDHVVDDAAPPKLAYIWTCPWCVSVWVGALVAGASALWVTDYGAALTIGWVFGMSAVTGIVADLLDA